MHTYKDGKEKKWIKMPRSGKIKDLTGKKSSQKVDLSSITMPLSLLKKDLSFLEDDVVNGVSCRIVKVKNKSGYALFWIDPIDYIVHKKQFFDKESSTYTYLVGSESNRDALIIDSVLENVKEYINFIRSNNLNLLYVLDTHIHADHISGMSTLNEHFDCEMLMGKETLAEGLSRKLCLLYTSPSPRDS